MKYTKLFISFLLMILCFCFTEKSFAATFTVTNTNDSGAGSLRQAILDANVNGQSDTINFDRTVFNAPQTITLTSGDLVMEQESTPENIKTLTINGPGANLLTISGNNQSRVFTLKAFNVVFINSVKISNGNGMSAGTVNSVGGAIYVGNGYFPTGEKNLVLTNSIVSDNTSLINIGNGGAISNFGSVVIVNSAIINNRAVNIGGAISASFDLTLINSTLSHNTASSAGGIYASGVYMNLINSTVAFNRAIYIDGGISNTDNGSRYSYLYARNSIIAKNVGGQSYNDIRGKITSGGNNIIGDTSGAYIAPEVLGNQNNIDPKIDVNLTTNGVVIPYHSPNANSPVFDRGNNCVLTATSNGGCVDEPIINDIRGVPRPQDADGNGTATVDVGNFEATPAEISIIPNKADLRAANDTGVSSVDNITSSQNLTFDVNNVSNGATVEFYRNGVLLESRIANGSSIAFTDNTVPPDGVFSYTTRQIISNVTSLFSESLAVTVDNTAPTVSVNQPITQNDPTRFQPINFTVTSSEEIVGLNSTDVSLAGSTAGVSSASIIMSGNMSEYNIEIGNITADGVIRASIPANSAQDVAGNNNLASTSVDNSVTLDTTAPTVTINQAATQTDPTRNSPINFTVVFSEPVTGFNNSSVSLAGSTATVSSAFISVTGSGTTYNVAVSSFSSNGAYVRASVIGNAAVDSAGNSSVASTSTDNQVTVDNVSPTVTINQAATQSDPTAVLPVNFTVVFSEPVTGFDSTDISFTGSTISTTQAAINITGSGTTYNVAVAGNLVSNGGYIQARINSGGAQDALGNGNLASTSTDNRVNIDNVSPSVTINQASGQADPASNQPLNFTVVFNENVSGFTASGISLNGSTANVSSANINVTGSGNTYSVTVSNITSSGQVRASVVANAAQDALGNPSSASTSTDNVITFNLIKPAFDFDGDRKTDIGIFRPSNGQWWYQRSVDNQVPALQFGESTDKIVPADYTGDGKTDIALFRPSTGQWFILRSDNSSFYAFPFGSAEDIPAPGDFDADGKADAAIFRPSTGVWYILRSSDGGVTIQQFGISEDKPVVADYDGDGRSDIGIYRPSLGQWWIHRSTAGFLAVQFGEAGDKTVQGDYTGDGKADIAFWRPSNGNWYILRSEDNSFYGFPFGANGDIPIPGDYDGDGKNDAAVFRSSNAGWYLQRTSSGTTSLQFGVAGDLPLSNAFVRQ